MGTQNFEQWFFGNALNDHPSKKPSTAFQMDIEGDELDEADEALSTDDDIMDFICGPQVFKYL
jgi:hypothetical protein